MRRLFYLQRSDVILAGLEAVEKVPMQLKIVLRRGCGSKSTQELDDHGSLGRIPLVTNDLLLSAHGFGVWLKGKHRSSKLSVGPESNAERLLNLVASTDVRAAGPRQPLGQSPLCRIPPYGDRYSLAGAVVGSRSRRSTRPGAAHDNESLDAIKVDV